MSNEVSCPFCKEGGFDLVGLKNHLERDCEDYLKIESIEEEEERLYCGDPELG